MTDVRQRSYFIAGLIMSAVFILSACGESETVESVAAAAKSATAPAAAPTQAPAGMAEGRAMGTAMGMGMGRPAPAPAPEGGFVTAPLIDPNTASAEDLANLTGISAELATAIIAGRPYATPTELHAALGDAVNENNQKDIYAEMFVPVGLNTATEEDVWLIPTTLTPEHLAREFGEYRPFQSVDHFKQEMSKYVSPEEVEFLARFVFID